MTGPGAGADPGAHGRRQGAPRRRDHRRDTPPSDHRHDTPARFDDREGTPPPSDQHHDTTRLDDGHETPRPTHPVVSFFRTNPQALVLLIICLVLGIGTFLAVLFGLVTAPTDQTTGEPSGAILGAHTVLAAGRWLI